MISFWVVHFDFEKKIINVVSLTWKKTGKRNNVLTNYQESVFINKRAQNIVVNISLFSHT
jgi:hypothetical protein